MKVSDDLDAETVDLLRFIADWQQPSADIPPLHWVTPPIIGWFILETGGLCFNAADYVRVWSFLWFPCQHPERSTDEAMLYDEDCLSCKAEQVKRGYPEPSPLARLADDAPIFREVPA